MTQEKAKSNSVLTHRIDGSVITFVVKDAGELLFDVLKASAACRAKAEFHGWIQRVSDAAAISRDTKTGLPATPMAKFEAMQKLVNHYEAGAAEWRMAGSAAGGGAGSAEKVLLVRCLAVMWPQRTAEQLAEWVGKRTAAERTALLSSEKIKPIADQFRSEAGAGVDADALLSEFDVPQGEEEAGE